MELRSIRTVVFSPTGTSRKIARAIARGASGNTPVAHTDLTHAAAEAMLLPPDTLAVFAVPVYGGKPAPAALERLQNFRGTHTPAVVTAVYGNRDIGSAAAELAAFLVRRGFVPVAAGAFVGEHSYSSAATPVAAGRPDADDLAAAEAFGAAVRAKLAEREPVAVDATRLRAPRTPLWSQLRFIRFVLRYRRNRKRHPAVLLPVTDAARCTHCGRCAALCPAEAIVRGAEERTDPARCIRCNACVKGCPVEARTYDTPFAAALSRNFSRRKEPVTLL